MPDKNEEYLNNLRHSCAHLLAAAVMEIYPKTKRAIGPAIENGFYYDFDFEKPVSEEDLPKIENRMTQILKEWSAFEKKEITQEEANRQFKDNPYKTELINEFSEKGEKLTIVSNGKFEDLCRGGHAKNPESEIKAFRLLSIAGAYWRGNEKNKMLTRIYGTCFPVQKELDEYLQTLEEAKKRDHKKLGPALGFFFFHETSPGMPYWLSNGLTVYNQLINFNRQELKKRDYIEVATPVLNKKELYQTSGHFDHYWQDMFVADMGKNEVYGIKAMNCPNAMVIYQQQLRSYRDLPLRLADMDTLHRYELSGVLNGLFRVREFRQDDAHIFISEDQIESEFSNLFEIVNTFYSAFGLEYSFRLGTRPEKFLGDIKTWNLAENVLKKILRNSGKEYKIEEGEGAFYGPKIDILMKDSLGRSWQMGTMQLDPNQPQRFKLKYTDSDSSQKTPFVIHRAIFGSLERFIGILIEHFSGNFPTWLAPVQITILPISEKFIKYAEVIKIKLEKENIRVKLDNRNETLQAKIRGATAEKIPYQIIIGAKETESENLSVRTRSGEVFNQVGLTDFLIKVENEIATRVSKW